MFSNRQMELLADMAQLNHNAGDGELAIKSQVMTQAVVTRTNRPEDSFSDEEIHVVFWAAEECFRQKSGPLSVYWMLEAYQWACAHEGPWTLQDVQELGRLVEPQQNQNGVRRTPVVIRQGRQPVGPQHVIPGLTGMLEATQREVFTPEEFYQEFQTIHPFQDGNGRVGAILFNALRGSLAAPTVPPHYRA